MAADWNGAKSEKYQMLSQMKAKDVNRHLTNLQIPKDEQKKIKLERRREKNK